MKKFLTLLTIALSLVLINHSCKPEPELPGSIYGVVTDKATGEPIKNANVQLRPSGETALTGADGRYDFQDIKNGDYNIIVSKTGYTDLLDDYVITVEDGKAVRRDVQIEKLPAALRVVDDKQQNIDVLDFGFEKADISRSFNLFNDGEFVLEWEITYNAEWIKSVSKISGTLRPGATQSLVVTIDRNKLSEGVNTTTLHITSDNGSKQLVIKATGDSMPVLNMLSVNNISKTTADFNGEVLYQGDPAYEERGFVYAKQTMPTIETTIVKLTAVLNSESVYKVSVSGLTMGEKYYVRAYAINKAGVSYSSNEIEFTMVEQSVELTTNDVENIDVIAGTAIFSASMTNVGKPRFSERGFKYGFSPNPSPDDITIKDSGNAANYNATITGLAQDKTYYVRAYAIQNEQLIYGNTVVFTTFNEIASVNTSAATNVSTTKATLNAYVAAEGNPPYTERGFCYSEQTNPTISNNKKVVGGEGVGNYSLEISDLNYQTTYYARAYVIQNGSPVYGNVVSFSTTWTEASVNTSATTNVSATKATLNAYVAVEGNPPYTERGFCYSEQTNPTISNNKKVVGGEGVGNYSLEISDLNYQTTYYARAYVIQNGSPVYGNVVSFSTTWTEASVSTLQPDDVTETSAELKAKVTSKGDPGFHMYGFCYNTYGNPTINNNKVELSTYSAFTGNYKMDITNLQSGETYYYRAFLRQGDDIVYGDEVSFTTIQEPELFTYNVTNIQGVESFMPGTYYQYTVEFDASIYNVGIPAYTERGFVYGTTSSPTAGTGKKVQVSGSGTGDFSTTVIVDCMQTYYVRAYVRTANGYVYANTVSFNTYD